MLRTSRASRRGLIYHVLDRGIGRSDVFHKDHDFAVFVSLMPEVPDAYATDWILSDDKPLPAAVAAAWALPSAILGGSQKRQKGSA